MIAAIALPVMVGFASLVAEYGHGLLVQAETQRTADAAAFAGALAYSANATTASMTSAANAVAKLNGVATSAVTINLVPSTTGDGNSAVQVLIASNVPLLLAPLLGGGANLPVRAASFAELKPNGSPCIQALSATGTGVTLVGGAAVTAGSCSVASNAAVTIPCGTSLTTKIVNYNSATAPSSCSGSMKPPSGVAAVTVVKKATTDPLASNAGVTGASASLAAVSSESAPAAPPAAPAALLGGGDIDFGYNIVTTELQAVADGCVALPLFNVWTLTCTGLVPFAFGNITLAGNLSLNFNLNPVLPAAAVYYLKGSITNSGATMTFGPGAYNVAKGIITGGGSTTNFGAGAFTVGAATTACGGAGYYSICNAGTAMNFSGPSTFLLRAGVYNAGGSTLSLGAGSTNSFQIGPASDGNALYMGGSANTSLGDAIGASSLFQLTGNVAIAGGASCTSFGAAASHDIRGNLITAGGTALGSGTYLITGYAALGGNGGGNSTCSGASLGLSGAGVTMVIGGAALPTSGVCSGYSFCVASGYSSVVLTAPTTGRYANLVIVGPTSASVTAGANLAQGSSGTSLSGAVYFPYGPVNLSGAASVGNGASQCLTLIGSTVTLTGGSTAASSCISGGNSGYAVSLVQ